MEIDSMSSRKSADEFTIFFSDGRPHTVVELTKHFGFSRITAFRKLKKTGALTSVNSRGQYYILPSGLKFNRYGLISIDKKVFYKGGNLLKAIIHIINNSPNGMKTVDLEQLLGTNIRLQVASLTKLGELYRKKQGRGYRYFSGDRKRRMVQMQREQSVSKPVAINTLLEAESTESLHDVVKVLITAVKHPAFSPKSIAISLMRRGEDIHTKQVVKIMNKYDIVKKTLDHSTYHCQC